MREENRKMLSPLPLFLTVQAYCNMWYDIIVLESSTMFYMTHDHVIMTCNSTM